MHHGVLPRRRLQPRRFPGFGGSPSPRGGAGGRGRSGGGAAAARLALKKAQERKALELYHQNRLGESEREYRQLIAAGSRNPEVYLNLAAVYWLTNRTQAAVEPLRTAIKLDPANPEALATLGTALQDTGDLDGAVAAYRRALELRPGFVQAMVSLGNAFFAQGGSGGGDRGVRPGPDGRASLRPGPRQQGGGPAGAGRVHRGLGVGDEILFASMLAEARQLAETVLVQADQRHLPLLRRSFPDLEFLDRAQAVPETLYDSQLAMGSLGR